MEDKWLLWAREIQSIAQAGLTYSKDKYDIERFQQLLDISATIVSEYTDIDIKIVKDLFGSEVGYLTPKVDVRAAIIKKDKILLVREAGDEWSLPGGWADVNLTVSENIKKECKEEAGVDVETKKIVAILDRNKHNTPGVLNSVYKIFVLCEYLGGEFKNNTETEESKFFGKDEMPKLSKPRNTEEQILMCFNAYENKSLETIFD